MEDLGWGRGSSFCLAVDSPFSINQLVNIPSSLRVGSWKKISHSMLRFSVCIGNSISTQIVTVGPLKHREKFIIKDQCKLFTVTMWFHVRSSLKLHVMLNFEQYP